METGGRKKKAAELLGIHRTTLQRLIKKLYITEYDVEEFLQGKRCRKMTENHIQCNNPSEKGEE